MGGDGGSIPGRADVVRTKGYGFKRNLGGMGYVPNTLVRVSDEKLTGLEQRKMRWKLCALTEQKLKPPIVCDRMGVLYNKEAILGALLIRRKRKRTAAKKIGIDQDGSSLPVYLKGLSDVREINTNGSSGAFGSWDVSSNALQCPISGTELTGSAKAFMNWGCGCVVSRKAWDAAAGSGINNNGSKTCPCCDSVITEVLMVNPDEDEQELMRAKLFTTPPPALIDIDQNHVKKLKT